MSSVEALLRDAGLAGVDLAAEGDRIHVRGPLPDSLRVRLRERRDDILTLLRREAYRALGRSDLAGLYRNALPWVLEHRPELHEAVKAADLGPDETNTEVFRAAFRRGVEACEGRPRGEAARIDSKGFELWIADTEESAADLRRHGVVLPVLLPDEVEVLRGIGGADAQALLQALVTIQRALPGARLRGVTRYDA